MKTLSLLLFCSSALGQTLTSTIPQPLPSGCVPTITASGTNYTLSCPSGTTPPPATCPPGQVGTPPNCTTPPPSGGGSGPCNGYANTLQMGLQWGKPGASTSAQSAPLGMFGANSALVIKFTTPSGTNTNLGSLSIAEYQGPPANRWLNRSNSGFSVASCDFSSAISWGQSANLAFTIGPNSMGAPVLNPSTTYYVNVHNDGSCGSNTNCSVLVTLKQPQGL